MASHTQINGLSLCAGVGGIDLALSLALGERYVARVLVEREAFAAAVLAARMQDGSIPEALIWSDLLTFDGRPWRGRVQVVSAGLPCQPYSVAGKQLGHEDERAIWPEAMRIIGEVQPALVFLENVPNFLQFFREPGEVLSGMGYRIEAGIFSAAEVGAPHRRERLFILAHSARDGGERLFGEGLGRRGVREDGGDVAHSRRQPGSAEQRHEPREGLRWGPSPTNGAGAGESSEGLADSRRLSRKRIQPVGQSGRGTTSAVESSGKSLADSTERGLGELRESSGGDRQPDGCDEAVGHAAGGNERYDRQPSGGRRQRQARRSGGDVEHACGTRRETSGERRDEHAGPESEEGDGALANARGERSQGDSQARTTTQTTGRGGRAEVADAECSRHNRPPPEPVGEPQQGASASRSIESLGLFPPGPGDIDEWRAILSEHPDLAPAIESSVRDVADGTAPRLDQLRALGNGVVAICGALAFITLAGKLGLKL